MDKDIASLYMKDIPLDKIPNSREQNIEQQVKKNHELFNNKHMTGFTTRKKIMRIISIDFENTDTFKSAVQNYNKNTAMLKIRECRKMQFYNTSQKPEYHIYSLISPFLPYSKSHDLTLQAPPLTPFIIRFSSSEALCKKASTNAELKHLLQQFTASSTLRNSNYQMSIIHGVLTMLQQTYPEKVTQARNKKPHEERHPLLHCKFLSHMVLTCLLYCSTNLRSFVKSSYFK